MALSNLVRVRVRVRVGAGVRARCRARARARCRAGVGIRGGAVELGSVAEHHQCLDGGGEVRVSVSVRVRFMF